MRLYPGDDEKMGHHSRYLSAFKPFTGTDTFANGVDPQETARSEPSHQDLHCDSIIDVCLNPSLQQ